MENTFLYVLLILIVLDVVSIKYQLHSSKSEVNFDFCNLNLNGLIYVNKTTY